MRAAFATLGCKVNAYETEAVAELFRVRGYEVVDAAEPADVVVLNTCTVTNMADRKSRQAIRHLTSLHPHAAVVVMGCYSQLQADAVARIPGVGVVLGTRDRHRVPELAEAFLANRRQTVVAGPLARGEGFEGLTVAAFEGHRRAFLKIEDGCDNFCSYCVIPYARGRVRSKAPDVVCREASALAAAGFAEIVLTGIHTGGYGRDLAGYRFADLLRDLAAIPGIHRIRISSIEIGELTDDVVAVLAGSPRFARHLHIPLQSGSDAVLRAMNRHYDTAAFAARLAALREALPGLAVTTDVIAGFPGETDADFAGATAFIRTMAFSALHVFPFSRRTGTVAATLPDQVPETTRKARVDTLLTLSAELEKAYLRTCVDVPLEAIAETWRDGFLQGHTGNYLAVRFPGSQDLVGRPVAVAITTPDLPYATARVLAPSA